GEAQGMGGEVRRAPRYSARCLSQQLCLFRSPIPPRFRRLPRAPARRAAIALAPCGAGRLNADPRSKAHCAPAARAGKERRVPGATHQRRGAGAGGVGRRAARRGRLHLVVRCQSRRAAVGGGRAMSGALALLWPSFLVAFCLVGIHAYFGIQVLKRNVIFVDLALAQIAALGATVAFMLGHPALAPATYAYSLAFTLLAALLIASTRVLAQRIPQEALIGVIYVVAAAAAILLIDRAPQGSEHLKQILTGNILTTGLDELAVIAPLYAAVALL